jgi:hypothetical protein
VLRGVTLRLIDELVRRVFGGTAPDAREGRERVKAARAAIAAARKNLVKRYKQAKRQGEISGTRSSFARELLLRPLGREGVTTDAEVLGEARERVLSLADHGALRERDEKRAGKRRAMMKRAASARAELLRPERCAELVANAERRAPGSGRAAAAAGEAQRSEHGEPA